MLLVSYMVLPAPAEQVLPRQSLSLYFIFVLAWETQAEGALTLQMNLLGLAGGLIRLSRKCLRYVYYTTNKNMHAISHTELYVIPQLELTR